MVLWQHQCLLHLQVSVPEMLMEILACLNIPVFILDVAAE